MRLDLHVEFQVDLGELGAGLLVEVAGGDGGGAGPVTGQLFGQDCRVAGTDQLCFPRAQFVRQPRQPIVLRRPAFFRVPAFLPRLALGEMAEETLLSSARVQPAKLLAGGYAFRFPELRAALEDLIG